MYKNFLQARAAYVGLCSLLIAANLNAEISFPMEQTIIDLLDDQEVQIAKVGLFQREGIMTTVVYRLKRMGIESSQELMDLESKITEKDIIREFVFWLGSGETAVRRDREKWSLGQNVIPVEAVIGRYDFGANVFKAEALSRLRPNSKGIIENLEYAHMLGFALPKSGLIQLPGGRRQTLTGEWVQTRTMVQLSDDKTTIAKIERFVDGKISQIVVNRSDGIKINSDFLKLQPSSLVSDGGGFQPRAQKMPPAIPSVDVLNKSVLGLGISTRRNTETAPFLVSFVADKSLAKAMGFEVGQVIEEINGESVTGLTRNEVVSRLKTLAGTADFTVKVSSGGPQSKTLRTNR